MKLKISILILFLILSINNVYCETDAYIYDADVCNEYYKSSYQTSNSQTIYGFIINDVVALKDLSFIECDVKNGDWGGSLAQSSFDWINLYSDVELTNYIGTGVFGFIRSGDNESVRVQLHIGTSLNWGALTGIQKIWIDTNNDLEIIELNYWYNTIQTPPTQGAYLIGGNFKDISVGCNANRKLNYTLKFKYKFINEIEYIYNNELKSLDYTIYRNSTYSSKLYINNSNITIRNETSLHTDNWTTYNFNLDNYIWDTHVTTENNIIIPLELDFSSLIDDEDDTQPILITDKTYYNTSEIINISFTNINKIYNECISSKCAKPYNLHILYPVTDEYKQYETKYIYPLTYLLENETISLNTSFLRPQNTYILGIVGINGDYTQHEDILIFSDFFTVYSDNEYLSVSCDSETSCYTYNNADITIYYKIDNNSDIIIKDNDNNIINTYHNIIDSGEILYHIPDDLNHINAYPNWKIYLNNTGYSTSFNKGITVYWSQFQTPTPTPTYTPSPTPDINISDTIDEFKTETQPIKDLIFGLSEIVIDNPDYNKDNIVDESEINHWFNSLIPICIIFLLVVLYVGLKKKRE